MKELWGRKTDLKIYIKKSASLRDIFKKEKESNCLQKELLEVTGLSTIKRQLFFKSQ